MPELHRKIPKKIGVLLSGETLWEIVFAFHQIETHGFLRMGISLEPEKLSSKGESQDRSIYQKLSGLESVEMAEVKIGSLQAVILAAGEADFNNLSDFELKGEAFGIDHGLRAFARAIYRRGLPIGAFGYAVPLLVKGIQGIARAGPVVTVGNNPKLQAGIIAAGAQAITTRPTEVVIDQTNKLVTSGGQLSSNRLVEVAADCENMLSAIIELIKG